MGILDWLFGRKDDSGDKKKSGKVSRKIESSPTSQTPENPPVPQKFNHPPRAQRDAHFAEPTSSTPKPSPDLNSKTPSGRSAKPKENEFAQHVYTYEVGYHWRQRRSKQPVTDRESITFDSTWPKPYFWQGKFGGKFHKPAKDGDSAKIEALNLPLLPRIEELAELLNISLEELARRVMRPAHRCYRADWIPKKSGGKRLLLRPEVELKAIQRTLLNKAINKLPLQDSVHGFRQQRDVLTGASVHVGRDVLISLDIQDFFPTLTFRRVSGYFRSCGY